MNKPSREIAWRYECDCGELCIQLTFLRSRINVTDSAVAELNSELQRYGIAPLAQRSTHPFGREIPYTADETAALLEPIEATVTAIWKREFALAGENAAAMRVQNQNTWGDTAESAIKVAVSLFPRNLPTDEELRTVRETVAQRFNGQTNDNGDLLDLDFIMSVARHRRRLNEIGLLQVLGGKVGGLRLAAASHHPEKQSGIFRQSFILLMTHFEAAVYDLTRLALKTNFFTLAAFFGQKEKVPYARFGQHQDFESLRDSLIDDLLKARYVKELLFDLNELGVVPIAERYEGFGRQIELILRRNIHLHNRGIVDAQYLETNREGKARWNIDGLSLGAFAPIGEVYFIRANNACAQYIEAFESWVYAGAVPNCS